MASELELAAEALAVSVDEVAYSMVKHRHKSKGEVELAADQMRRRLVRYIRRWGEALVNEARDRR